MLLGQEVTRAFRNDWVFRAPSRCSLRQRKNGVYRNNPRQSTDQARRDLFADTLESESGKEKSSPASKKRSWSANLTSSGTCLPLSTSLWLWTQTQGSFQANEYQHVALFIAFCGLFLMPEVKATVGAFLGRTHSYLETPQAVCLLRNSHGLLRYEELAMPDPTWAQADLAWLPITTWTTTPCYAKKSPILGAFYLPSNFTLLYGRGDGSIESVLNELVKHCDKEASTVLDAISRLGYYQDGEVKYPIDQIPIAVL